MIIPYFENIRSVIIYEITNCKTSVKVISAYFTDDKLLECLCSIAKNGIKIELIITDEKVNTVNDKIDFSKLIDLGGKVYITSKSQNCLVHHKFCIIDDKKLLTGSYNWTKKASSNRENLILLSKKKVVLEYLNEFEFVKNNYSDIFDISNELTIDSGFKNIDSMTDGFKSGDLICIAGEGGIGKTDFVVNLISHFINNEIKYGYLSSTLALKYFLEKLNSVNEFELSSLSENISFSKCNGRKLEDLERQIREMNLKNSKIIILDGVDYYLNHQYEFAQSNDRIFQKLKNLARRFRIPIVVVCEKLSSITSKYSNIILHMFKDEDNGIVCRRSKNEYFNSLVLFSISIQHLGRKHETGLFYNTKNYTFTYKDPRDIEAEMFNKIALNSNFSENSEMPF